MPLYDDPTGGLSPSFLDTGASPSAVTNKVASAVKNNDGPAGGGVLGLLGGGLSLGPGALAGSSPSSSAKSGDASAGLTAPFQYNSAFQVGGSGSQSQSQSADQSGGMSKGTNTLVYIALGIAGLVAVAAVLRK